MMNEYKLRHPLSLALPFLHLTSRVYPVKLKSAVSDTFHTSDNVITSNLDSKLSKSRHNSSKFLCNDLMLT